MAPDSGNDSITKLRTARLRLRELVDGDLDFVAGMLGDPRVMRFYPSVLDRAGARDWLERQRERYARDGHGLWLASLDEGGVPVGQVGLVTQHVGGEAMVEVAYLLDSAHWGRGYATEAAAAVRDHAFRVLGCRHVVSLVRPVNAPSQAVARRIGMRPWRRARHRGLVHDVLRAEAPVR